MGDKPWLNLSDIGPIDEVLDGVHDDGKRLLVARVAVALITADGRVRDIERRVFDHMLYRWRLTRQDVSQAILREQATIG